MLVVDECDLVRAQGIHAEFAAARGRVRVVTLGDRGSHREWTGGGVVHELPPLAVAELSDQLKEAVGLPADHARFVAEHTEGYPQLAWQLAQVVSEDATQDITSLTRQSVIGVLLDRMLPVAEHRHLLGVLALFNRLGFADELAGETAAVCAAFEIDEGAFRTAIEKERDVVRTVGRYRHVTPLLFAVWVGGERLAQHRVDLATRLSELPPQLYEQFALQFEYFGPQTAAKELVRDSLPAYTALDSLTGNTGRFLRAAAAVDRGAVAVTIYGLVTKHRGNLKAFTKRRDAVWTLEYLLWFPDTFEEATRALFLLALAETEEGIANNARGILTGVLRVMLGGTSVGYDRRLAVFEGLVQEEDSDEARVLMLDALGHAFGQHETRGTPSVTGGVLLPDEWRPATWGDVAAIRQDAWRRTIQTVTEIQDESIRDDSLLKVIEQLRNALLGASDRNEVLRDVLAQTSPRIRAKAAEQIRMTLEYDEPPDDLKDSFERAIADLAGDSLKSQLEYVLAAEPWEIARGTDDDSSAPAELAAVAARLAGTPEEVATAIQLAAESKTNTAGLLFDLLAQEKDAKTEWFQQMLESDPLPLVPIAGFLSGRDKVGDPAWVSEQLRRLDSEERWQPAFPGALYAVRATDERGGMATQGVGEGRYKGAEFGRMLYGAWARPLSEQVFIDLVRAIAGDPRAHEAAVGMTSQYVDELEQVSEPLAQLIRDLLEQTPNDPHDRGMTSHYRERLLKVVKLEPDEELSIFFQAVRTRETFPRESEYALFDQVLEHDPEGTVRAIVDALLEDIRKHGWSKWGMWLEEMHFLSRATRLAGPGPVTRALKRLSETELASLMAHFQFEGGSPDVVLKEIIESADSDELLGAASTQFIHTPSGWTGSRVPVLERRRADAVGWAKAGGKRLKQWAEALLPYFDAEIEREQLRDAEDLFR